MTEKHINSLTVGPIVGFTSSNQVRIWGRSDPSKLQAHLKEGGSLEKLPQHLLLIRYWETDSNVSSTQETKLKPHFDMSGVIVLDGLKENTNYEYQIRVLEENSDASTLDWDRFEIYRFKTASDDKTKERTIVFGSCRYLLRLWDLSIFDDRGDKVFNSIYQLSKNSPIDQFLMIGDQIYADDLNSFHPDKSLEQYLKRYRDAFSQKHIKKLMANVPTYMILDDHEIEDNWPQHASALDLKKKYMLAMHAYSIYQVSHSPVCSDSEKQGLVKPKHFWYQYSDGCADFFVLDARTERDLSARRIFNEIQLDALFNWLNDGSDRVKVIVSSVTFFPDLKTKDDKDKWGGFSEQRSEILNYIFEYKIPKTLFLCGDIHLSVSAELENQRDPNIKIISATSSPFFWPYPHNNKNNFSLDKSIDGGNSGDWNLKNISNFIAEDNFNRLKITPKEVQIEVFNRKGTLLDKKKHIF